MYNKNQILWILSLMLKYHVSALFSVFFALNTYKSNAKRIKIYENFVLASVLIFLTNDLLLQIYLEISVVIILLLLFVVYFVHMFCEHWKKTVLDTQRIICIQFTCLSVANFSKLITFYFYFLMYITFESNIILLV